MWLVGEPAQEVGRHDLVERMMLNTNKRDVIVDDPLAPAAHDHRATGRKRSRSAPARNGAGPERGTGSAYNIETMNVPRTPLGFRNMRMMHLLERIARRFNAANVPLMALKGAALSLTLYARPDERAMGDLDLMVRASDIDQARALLEALGGLRGEPLVREDFFPRFHYEIEYTLGSIYPVKVDLHVRPFRPLRYVQTVPDDALWQRAELVEIGAATLLVPSVENMLIHLCVHAAVHGCTQQKWVAEIKRWTDNHKTRTDWECFATSVQAWCLVVPVWRTLSVVGQSFGQAVPEEVLARLSQTRMNWRDQLALWQAPRDAKHPAAHVAVNLLCTRGWRFRLSYLWAVLVPDKAHMADWYDRRHPGWLVIAHVLRCLGPVGVGLRTMLGWRSSIEVRPSPIHGLGVFARRHIRAGKVIARYFGNRVERDGTYVVCRRNASGRKERLEIMGKLKFLNHSCHPNAQLSGFTLRAREPICEGQEVTIEYEGAACTCKQKHKYTVAEGIAHDPNTCRGLNPAVAVRLRT